MIVSQFNIVELKLYVVWNINVDGMAIGGAHCWQLFVVFISHIIQINLYRCAYGSFNLYTTHINGLTFRCSHAVNGLEKVIILTENNNRIFVAHFHLQVVAIKTTAKQREDIK